MSLDDTDTDDSSPRLPFTATPTLLPTPVARAVSLVTQSSSLSLRLGSFVGGLALDGARITTLASLEVSRAVLESMLRRAGQDLADRSAGRERGRDAAENLVEKSLAALHGSITTLSFAAAAGFYLTTSTLESASEVSQHLLTALDSILGSTDTSRAMASLITLVRREFQNPATGVEGEKVSVLDLVMGGCGFLLLQRWCRRITDAEEAAQGYEDVVWDIVLLEDGRTADVVDAIKTRDSALRAPDEEVMRSRPASFMTALGDNEVLQVIQRQDAGELGRPEEMIRNQIMEQLPVDATVNITTEPQTVRKITVEISGTRPVDISPPPGLEVVEEGMAPSRRRHSIGFVSAGDFAPERLSDTYRIVYQSVQDSKKEATWQARDGKLEQLPAHPDVVDVTEVPTTESSSSLALPSSVTTSPVSSPNEEEPPPLELPPVQPARPAIRTRDSSLAAKTSQPATAASPPPPSSNHSANQKKSRKPSSAGIASGSETSGSKPAKKTKLPQRKTSDKTVEKKGTALRNALRKGSSTSISNILGKDSTSRSQEKLPDAGQERRAVVRKPAAPAQHLSLPKGNFVPRAPQRGNPNFFSSRDLGVSEVDVQRSPSRSSYISVHERRRDSLVSQTDTYSIHSTENNRPGSPTAVRSHLRNQSSLLRSRSEKNVTIKPSSPPKHRRAASYVPSIYTLNTNSAMSLVLAQAPRHASMTREMVNYLARTGEVNGVFPQGHLVRNMARFVRFASASYGSYFLKLMGITPSTGDRIDVDPDHHYEHHSFSSHIQLPPDTILLSSFVDPQGGTDSTGHTNAGIPMVHYVSLDHDSRAVVLTCRGTMGFEDVLTDLTCDYDDLVWRGKPYKVHKGIHASARRLLNGSGGRVMATIRAALEEFPTYGLVLCGHSLGGGVTSLLAVMLSAPVGDGGVFCTASEMPLLLAASANERTAPLITLPPGRRIHVYAYGPPGTMSPALRNATKGLITTVINGQDVVPYLSLGVLHDMQAVALAFKTDDSGAKAEVKSRIWSGLTSGFVDQWYGRASVPSDDDEWAYASLKTLRSSMLFPKLLPPGEVFMISTQAVLQRHAFAKPDGVGRPARRVVLKYVRRVDARLAELRFGASMLMDHSPGRYESSLATLSRGLLDSGVREVE